VRLGALRYKFFLEAVIFVVDRNRKPRKNVSNKKFYNLDPKEVESSPYVMEAVIVGVFAVFVWGKHKKPVGFYIPDKTFDVAEA
jgi:hypothetical protein